MIAAPPLKWSLVWGTWYTALLSGVFFIPNLWWDRGVFVAFWCLEMYAAWIRTEDRDTLSEFSQWIASWAKPGARWYQSWNALAFGLLTLVSYQAGYVVSMATYEPVTPTHLWGVFYWGPRAFFGVATFVVIEAFLLWHFLRRDKTG